MASRNYKYYQPNDKDLKDQYGDCVVRAIDKSYAAKLGCRYLMILFHMQKNFNACQTESNAMKAI